jgi:hypothetical protein
MACDSPDGRYDAKDTNTHDTEEHARMMRFTKEKVALKSEDWVRDTELDAQVTRALQWMQGLPVEKIIAKREKAIRLIEKRARKFVKK